MGYTGQSGRKFSLEDPPIYGEAENGVTHLATARLSKTLRHLWGNVEGNLVLKTFPYMVRSRIRLSTWSQCEHTVGSAGKVEGNPVLKVLSDMMR